MGWGALLYFTVVTLASPWCPIKNLTAGLNWPRMFPVSPESSSAEVNRSFPLCCSTVICQARSYRQLLQWWAGADARWLWRGDCEIFRTCMSPLTSCYWAERPAMARVCPPWKSLEIWPRSDTLQPTRSNSLPDSMSSAVSGIDQEVARPGSPVLIPGE